MHHRSVLSAIAATLLVAACGGSDDTATGVTSASPPSTSTSPSTTATGTEASTSPPDQAGVPPIEVLKITVGNVNEASASEGATLQEFAKQVDDLSGGNIKVNYKWDLDGTSNGLDHPTAEAVETGEVDVAAEWAGAWGTQGVTTLQATQTPLLIRSFEQANAVLRDDELVSGMLAGLDRAGVVGLSMFPVDLRPIIDFEHPVTGPADLHGQVFRSPWSNETWPFLTAIGAEPNNYPPQPAARDFSPGNQASLPKGWVVGNLPLGFRFYTLVANEDFWSGLNTEQQGVLQQAAVAARDFAMSTQTEEKSVAEMAKYCARGGTVVELDQPAIDAFVAAAAPSRDQLRADPFTASAIDTIDQLGGGVAPTVFPACDPDEGSLAGPDATFPEGVYRFEITDEDLERAQTDPANWSEDRGIYTFTLKGGKFSYAQQADEATTSSLIGEGTYAVDGNFVTFTEPAGPNNEPNPTVMTWEVDADRSLSFKIITANFNYVEFIYGEPWIRIGDAP